MAKERIFSAEDVNTKYGLEKIAGKAIESLGYVERIQQLGFADANKVDLDAVAEAKTTELKKQHPDMNPRFIEAQVGQAINEAIQQKRQKAAEHNDLSNIVTAGGIEELSMLTEKANELGVNLNTTVTYVYGEGSDKSVPTADDLLKIKMEFKGQTAKASIPAMLMQDQAMHFQKAAEGKIESQTMAEHKAEVETFLNSEQGLALQNEQKIYSAERVYSELNDLRQALIESSPVLAKPENVRVAVEDYMVTKYVRPEHLPDHSKEAMTKSVNKAILESAAEEVTNIVDISQAVRDKRAGLSVA